MSLNDNFIFIEENIGVYEKIFCIIDDEHDIDLLHTEASKYIENLIAY